MKKLIKGLHKFQTQVFPVRRHFYENLVKGQNPEVLFITCSDSRINPNLVTSSDLGELFILRNAGNIVPAYGHHGSEEATIEFAIDKLKIKDIILCGHSHCGAVQAVTQLDDIKDTANLYAWIKKHIEPTLDLVKANYENLDHNTLLNILTQEHALKQIENLKTYPIINKAIAENNLSLHAWIYKFETGNIFYFDVHEGQFNLLNLEQIKNN